jgi:regulator of nonsense transcripts 2
MNSKALIDQATVEFAFVNSKAARNRLIKFLCAVPVARSDLFPFYARLVAILKPFMPDIAAGLLAVLEDDIRYLTKRKTLELRDLRPKVCQSVTRPLCLMRSTRPSGSSPSW